MIDINHQPIFTELRGRLILIEQTHNLPRIPLAGVFFCCFLSFNNGYRLMARHGHVTRDQLCKSGSVGTFTYILKKVRKTLKTQLFLQIFITSVVFSWK